MSDLKELTEFRQALDQIALSAVLDADARFVSANELLLGSLGVTFDEIKGNPFDQFLAPDFPQLLREFIFQNLQSGNLWKGELHFLSKTGRSIWLEASIVPARRDSPVFYFVAFDISERKLVEYSLASSRAFLKTLMEHASVGFFIADESGACSYINQRWSEISGARLRHALGSGWLNALHPEDKESVRGDWMKLVQSGIPFNREYRYVHASGEEVWVLASGIRIELNEVDKVRFLRVEHDLTERKQNEKLILEQQAKIIDASKQSSLGEMASGIAHEINNPLAIIAGRAFQIGSRIKDNKIDPDWLLNAVETIENTVQRIAKIIKSMQRISRGANQDIFQTTPIQEIISEAIAIGGARFAASSIELVLEPFPLDLQLTCRPVQICQLLVNLLNNSYDAVRELGTGWVRVNVCEQPEHIEIWVTDSGPGIAPHLREKIFQPFFTTKPPGSGTGLGLSISKTIAVDHQGELSIDLQCPNTRFVLSLPKNRLVTKVA